MDSILSLSVHPWVDVCCNWEVNMDNKSIRDCVMLKMHKEESSDKEDLIDIMGVNTTVNFIKTVQISEKPFVKFQVPEKDDLYISALTMLCDCKIVEVFGDHDTYITTVNGSAVEESDGFYVYEHKMEFDQKVNKEVTLKLMKLVHGENFWIYGILLTFKKKPAGSKASSISYEMVEEYMKNSHISDQAAKAFSFMKDNSGGGRRGGGDEDSSFAFSPDATAKAFSFMKDNAGFAFNPDARKDRGFHAELRQYIDYKFQVLTDYLIMREKNICEKMDRIIEMMKPKNTNH